MGRWALMWATGQEGKSGKNLQLTMHGDRQPEDRQDQRRNCPNPSHRRQITDIGELVKPHFGIGLEKTVFNFGDVCYTPLEMSQKGKKTKTGGRPDLGPAWPAALSHLTKGFVHDVNNCLASILSLSENCQILSERKEPIGNELKVIKASAQKASELLLKLSEWHSEEAGLADYHDLNAVVEGCVESLRHVLPRRIELQFVPAPGHLPVHLKAVELRQAILALALDAENGSPGTNRITFTTSRRPAGSPPEPCLGKWPERGAVCLTMTDQRPPIEWKGVFAKGNTFANRLHELAARLVLTLPGALWVDVQDLSQTTIHITLAEAEL